MTKKILLGVVALMLVGCGGSGGQSQPWPIEEEEEEPAVNLPDGAACDTPDQCLSGYCYLLNGEARCIDVQTVCWNAGIEKQECLWERGCDDLVDPQTCRNTLAITDDEMWAYCDDTAFARALARTYLCGRDHLCNCPE